MHATNTFSVDRHPQYRHYPTTIRSIVSDIIIEVRKNHINPYSNIRRIFGMFEVDSFCMCSKQYTEHSKPLWNDRCEPIFLVQNSTPNVRWCMKSNFTVLSTSFNLIPLTLTYLNHPHAPQMPPCILTTLFIEWERNPREVRHDLGIVQLHGGKP